jgi:heterodisulfide reductase subunit C2
MQSYSSNVSAGAAAPFTSDLSSVIHQCYQCYKCSAGCPVASEFDLLPHQLVRLAVLGDVEKIENSKSLWLCLTCHTCGARCPNGIDVPTLLDPIRHAVLKRKKKSQNQQIATFHQTFMQTVKLFGRVHELTLIGLYKFKTRTFMEDMELGMNMFRKGKIHILPHRASHVSEVRDVFKKAGM